MRWRLALVVCAVAAALAPSSPAFIERFYSAGVYAAAQPWVTRASNAAPFALIDLLLIGLAGAWIAATVGDLVRRRSWLGALAAILVRTLVWAAASYLIFLAMWGLNYRRVALADKLQFDASRVSADSARALAMAAVEQANALYAAAHASPPAAAPVDAALAQAFARAQRDLGAVRLAAPGRPKRTMLDLYFTRAGVDGMTDPFFLETLVTGDLLAVERPFVVAHEWSHLAGIVDEGEANFAGWLTCLRGTEAHRYSGWLFLVGEVSRSLRASDRAGVGARLAPGPRADLRAIAQRVQAHLSPQVAAVGWRVYDRYLKANRVESGTASYAQVVKLALGVEFAPDWVPRLRTMR